MKAKFFLVSLSSVFFIFLMGCEAVEDANYQPTSAEELSVVENLWCAEADITYGDTGLSITKYRTLFKIDITPNGRVMLEYAALNEEFEFSDQLNCKFYSYKTLNCDSRIINYEISQTELNINFNSAQLPQVYKKCTQRQKKFFGLE